MRMSFFNTCLVIESLCAQRGHFRISALLLSLLVSIVELINADEKLVVSSNRV